MIVIPNGKTGNKKLDQAIAKSQSHNAGWKNTTNIIVVPENKYGVAPKEDRTGLDGFVYDSKGEMDRWDVLRLIQKAGKISHLERQVKFVLQEKFFHHNEMYQPIVYIADFMYLNISFRDECKTYWVVEDKKGFKTADYKIKKKLFLRKYPHYYFFEV